MTTSELITLQHLQKKAVIYVRQSTLTQVMLNQESLRLQYALEQRAQSLGWRAEDIEVIDADLGLTGASAQHRTGFQELVTKVTLGQAGIILSSDVTRLSRNCSDWYPRLGCVWLSWLPHRRSGWGLRSRVDQRALAAWSQGAALRTGTPYHSRTDDRRAPKLRTPRGTRLAAACRPHPRCRRSRAQGPPSRGARSPRTRLYDFFAEALGQ